MSQAGLVARVAVRELWMTFRLLAVLIAFVGGSAVVALIPAVPAVTLERLGMGLGAATVVSAAVAAWTMAGERASGRAGWFVLRSVSRGTYLSGWFAGLLAIVGAGVAGSGLFGWLATLGLTVRLDPLAFAATLGAVIATAAAAIALGLAAGALLRAGAAAGVAVAACAGLAAAVLTAAGGAGWALPGEAYLLLPRLASPASVLPDALRAAGLGLLLAAVLLVLARAAMERAEL